MKRYACVVVLLVFGLSACKPATVTSQPEVLIHAPAISMGISRATCTSMEVRAGTQLTWTNDDTVMLSVSLKQLDERGNETDISGSEIGPGDHFSTRLSDAGTYRFYCSDEMYGTIAVK